jgi:hypothetical protein
MSPLVIAAFLLLLVSCVVVYSALIAGSNADEALDRAMADRRRHLDMDLTWDFPVPTTLRAPHAENAPAGAVDSPSSAAAGGRTPSTPDGWERVYTSDSCTIWKRTEPHS